MCTLIFILLYGYEHAGLQALGPDFVFGYVQAIDGEKDPRNLLTVFRLTKLVIQGLDISRFAEVGRVVVLWVWAWGDWGLTLDQDLCEVTSCYYPITFTPPPDDQHGITRDDLRDALKYVQYIGSGPIRGQ